MKLRVVLVMFDLCGHIVIPAPGPLEARRAVCAELRHIMNFMNFASRPVEVSAGKFQLPCKLKLMKLPPNLALRICDLPWQALFAADGVQAPHIKKKPESACP